MQTIMTQRTVGNIEWNKTEIKTFIDVIKAGSNSSLQKKFCDIMSRIAHKRMIDVWIFYQFYLKTCSSEIDWVEISSAWNTFRENPKNMIKLSQKLSDIKIYEQQFIKRSEESKTNCNEIFHSKCSSKNLSWLSGLNNLDIISNSDSSNE